MFAFLVYVLMAAHLLRFLEQPYLLNFFEENFIEKTSATFHHEHLLQCPHHRKEYNKKYLSASDCRNSDTNNSPCDDDGDVNIDINVNISVPPRRECSFRRIGPLEDVYCVHIDRAFTFKAQKLQCKRNQKGVFCEHAGTASRKEEFINMQSVVLDEIPEATIYYINDKLCITHQTVVSMHNIMERTKKNSSPGVV